jgi:hypothetical protein
VALGLTYVLATSGAVAEGPDAAAHRLPACGKGYSKPPPKRYRFSVAGSTTSDFWGDGRETYVYRGVLRRAVCIGTKVQYWQTKGTVTQTFKNVIAGPPACELTGYPPNYGLFNGTRTRRLRRNEVDVEFDWRGNKYETSVVNPNKGNPEVQGTTRCPDPPAANGATVPDTFKHASTPVFTLKSLPRRVVKGRIVKYHDYTDYFYSFHWKLTAIK